MAYAFVDAPAAGRFVPQVLRTHGPVVALLLFVALVTRLPWFGDPAITNDEQFYLLVGDRMWHGVLPYVDLWDRKPIGLFLIYAAIRPFSSDGIVAYQVAALLAATGTAFIISRVARRLVPAPAAAFAGCLYLVLLPVFGGLGGQSPVFYNLLMAGAGLLVVKSSEGTDDRRARRYALAAMLLAGLAIQVKYTAFVEGIGFGVWLMVIRLRRGDGLVTLARRAALWIFVAVLPTVLATLAFIAAGHGDAFIYANFTSIFLKHAPVSETGNIAANLILIGPLMAFAACAFILAWRKRRAPQMTAFLAVWTVAAFGGYLVIGHFYTHYLMPTLVPLTIVCALLAEHVVVLVPLVLYAGGFYLASTEYPGTDRIAWDHRKIDGLVQAMSPYTRYGCLYLADGPAIVYHLTHSCLPSRYTFNEHLSNASERYAVDQPAGLAAVLARHPPAIALRRFRDTAFLNVENDRTLRAVLAADYRWTAYVPVRKPQESIDVYVRKDLP